MYRFAINRPITTLMMIMTFIVFGLISYKTMPINLFPNVDFPVVSIQTPYYGADASTVETKVTDKLEEAVSGIDGIKKLKSTSYNGFSSVIIQFELTKDLDEATNDVRDKIGSVTLPREVEKPIVRKLGVGGSVISLFVAAKKGELQALMRLADEKLKPKLQRIKGVGAVDILGYRDREIRIYLDPDKLNKYGLTSYELRAIIASQNISQGVGKIITKDQEIVLKTQADASSIEDLGKLVVKPGVLLSDIASIQDGLSDPKSYSSLNNTQGITLVVKKISGENVLNIIKGVKAMMPKLTTLAGKGYQLQLIEDQSDKIMVNMHNVTFDLIYGSILAILIVFFFLRSVTATIVSALAIPASVIGTFAIINWLGGYDLNRLTMIGLTLAIGIFIDDAIVVIENITKKMEEGLSAFKASLEGIAEVAFSILAISSVLLAVFIPVAFMDGIVGLFFNSFAMTVASGIVLSFLVAVMLIPTVGARVLHEKQSRFYYFTEPAFVLMDRVYVSILTFLLRFKLITVLVTIGLLIASATLKVGMDFMPMEDNSEIRVIIKAPVGTSLEKMQERVQPLLTELQADENVSYTVLSVAYTAAKETHKAKIYAKLVTKDKRPGIKQESIIQHYRESFARYKDLKISVEDIPPFETGASNAPVQVVITGSSLEKLDKISTTLMQEISQIQGLVDIDRDYEGGKPQISITILKENAKRAGVSAQAISAVLGSAYSSDSPLSYYEEGGREFDITMRLDDRYRDQIEDIRKLQVRNKEGQLVSLEGLITFDKSSAIASINRYDMERKVMVTAGLYGVSLNSVMDEITAKLEPLLPSGYNYRFTGDIENMQDTAKAFAGAIVLAVILIYLILAALYESLIQPIIIMISMPLSFTGVMVALYLTGNNFSLFVMIGIIMLLGMVGKNAILVVDYANRAIKEGMELDAAILQAGEKRLRPILMTTFAMIGAMVPLAFGTGAGSEGNAPMALAIIGGLVSSTVLTLLVVPAIYKLLYPLDSWLRKWYERGMV